MKHTLMTYQIGILVIRCKFFKCLYYKSVLIYYETHSLLRRTTPNKVEEKTHGMYLAINMILFTLTFFTLFGVSCDIFCFTHLHRCYNPTVERGKKAVLSVKLRALFTPSVLHCTTHR